MKFKQNNLNFKLLKYFSLFTAIILIGLWLIQIVFISSFFEQMKSDEIEKAAKEITESYGTANFELNIEKLSFKNALLVMVFSDSGILVYSSDGHGRSQMSPPKDQFLYGRETGVDLVDLMERLSQNGGKQVAFTQEQNGMGKSAILFSKMGTSPNEAYLYMRSPIQPVDSTVEVLKRQLVYVTILSLALGIIVSIFISRRLSAPITKLTESAKELAKGNYDVTFENGDYYEIDELAAALNYATNELSNVNELRRDLIANISHDLRTPLTMVKAYGEMIRDISGDNPQKRNAHLKIIIDEADRLAALVNDLLDLSKIETGNLEIGKEVFNISKTADAIISRMTPLRNDEGYIINTEIAENLYVNADKLKIEQVIYNLAANAVNYTGDDKKVSIRLIDKGNAVRFEAQDTGVGIPKKELANIWDRYYKVKETHKRAVAGTGIGLSIVKGILNAHHANFGVKSKPGKGSMFWFELDKAPNPALALPKSPEA